MTWSPSDQTGALFLCAAQPDLTEMAARNGVGTTVLEWCKRLIVRGAAGREVDMELI